VNGMTSLPVAPGIPGTARKGRPPGEAAEGNPMNSVDSRSQGCIKLAVFSNRRAREKPE